MDLLARLDLVGKLGLRVLGRPELPGMLVDVVAKDALEIGHALLDGRVGGGLLLPVLGEEVLHGAVVLVPCGTPLIHLAVEVVEALLRRGELLRVLVRRVLEQHLQVAQPLLHRSVLFQGCSDRLHVPRVLVMGRRMFGMGGLHRLQLAPVLVSGVSQRFLQVLDPLRQRGVLRVGVPALLQLPGVPRMRVLHCLQLPCVLFRRVADELLQVDQALLNGGVAVGRASKVFGILLMRRPEGLQLLAVAVGVVAQLPLQEVHALW
mmetsp:Transcript_23246/g.66062  ORF Transcript_23246/g.66062 Transcript_23246/m.66062 type:complete len:263 (-) Transcript_23246:2419-3207(-)